MVQGGKKIVRGVTTVPYGNFGDVEYVLVTETRRLRLYVNKILPHADDWRQKWGYRYCTGEFEDIYDDSMEYDDIKTLIEVLLKTYTPKLAYRSV